MRIYFPESGLLHEMGKEHRESPKRLRIISSAIKKDTKLKAKFKKSKPASIEQLLRVHTLNLIELIRSTADRDRTYLTPDTIANRYTWRASLDAAGAAIAATRYAYKKKTVTVSLARPPGHHATADVAMGFCFFNNVAIAAADILNQKKVERVAILDLDQHHGNGTQEIFFEKGEVLYISVHAESSFPGTGKVNEAGTAEGIGKTINIPVPLGTTESNYLFVIDQLVLPIITQFKPDILLLSMGFDGLRGDPYGDLSLAPQTYYRIGKRLNLLKDLFRSRVACILEGGYNFELLGKATTLFLRGLEGIETDVGEVEGEVSSHFIGYVQRLRSQFRIFWDL